MVMRVTENMKLNTSIASLYNVQSQYNSVLEKMSSQKRINKLSDDPVGMTVLLGYRQVEASLEQYERNIDSAEGWLSVTESKLSAAEDLLTTTRELAVAQATDTATAKTRLIVAGNIEQIKEEMLTLANSEYGNRYLFSGSRMDTAPFSVETARIDDPVPASGNTFDGEVDKGGAYIGTTNKTFMVEIVTGGALADATYQVSSDGGGTWGAEQSDLDTGTITVGDGVELTFTEGTNHLAAGDLFYVDAYALVAAAQVDDPVPAPGNTFDGTVVEDGAYTGTTNKTFAVKTITGGLLADATYQVSSDGGKTWGAEQSDLDTGTITLGDGVELTFTEGTNHLAAGDLFYVHAYAKGYYNGNNEDLNVDIAKETSITYNVTGAKVFTDANGGVDIFGILDDLKVALETNDRDGIQNQLENIEKASEQVTLAVSNVGVTRNRLELARNNIEDLNLKVTELMSNVEDADIAELTTSLAMKEIALQASYAVAAQIGQNTILDFIS